jgi:hypothetical protein
MPHATVLPSPLRLFVRQIYGVVGIAFFRTLYPGRFQARRAARGRTQRGV